VEDRGHIANLSAMENETRFIRKSLQFRVEMLLRVWMLLGHNELMNSVRHAFDLQASRCRDDLITYRLVDPGKQGFGLAKGRFQGRCQLFLRSKTGRPFECFCTVFTAWKGQSGNDLNPCDRDTSARTIAIEKFTASGAECISSGGIETSLSSKLTMADLVAVMTPLPLTMPYLMISQIPA